MANDPRAKTLFEVIEQLKKNDKNDATRDKEMKVILRSLAIAMQGLVNAQNSDKLKDLESSREKRAAGKGGATNKTTVLAGPSGIGGIFSGAGIGIGAAGAGIGAFFMGLAGAEAIMNKFGSGDNLKKLLTNLAEGMGAFATRDLMALGGMFAMGGLFGSLPTGPLKIGPKGKGIEAGVGIAAAGVGIAGFMAAFAVSDAVIKMLDQSNPGENLKKLMVNIAEGLSAFTSNDKVAKAMALILGTGAVAGVAGGMGKGKGGGAVAAGVGIGAVGGGLALFISALALSDTASSFIGADGANFKTLSTNLVAGLDKWADIDDKWAGILAGAGLFGMIGGALKGGRAGPKGAVRRGFGKIFSIMAMIGGITGIMAVGLAISGFVSALALGDAAISFLGADGTGFKIFSENVTAGLKAWMDPELKGLIAATGIFGAAVGLGSMIPGGGVFVAMGVGGAMAGITAVGVSIGLFMLGLGAADWIIQKMSGSEAGAGIKAFLVNTADGVKAWSGMDYAGFKEAGEGLGSLGGGIAKFFGGLLAGGIFDTAGDVIGGIKTGIATVVDLIFGTDTKSTANESLLDKIVRETSVLADEGTAQNLTKGARNLNILSMALERFTGVLGELGNLKSLDVGKSMTNILTDISNLTTALPFLLNGGTWDNPNRLGGWGDNINFGKEGIGGLNNLSTADLQQLRRGLNRLMDATGALRGETTVMSEFRTAQGQTIGLLRELNETLQGGITINNLSSGGNNNSSNVNNNISTNPINYDNEAINLHNRSGPVFYNV